MRGSSLAWVVVGCCVGCGGSVTDEVVGAGARPGVDGGTGGGAMGGSGGLEGGADAGSGGTGGDAGIAVDAGDDGGPFVDPGCPDASPPPPVEECDPFAEPTGCGPGEGCFPFVDNPDDPCQPETFGTVCRIAGTRTQGEACGGTLDCADGFLCVITTQDTQCVQLCPRSGEDSCPPGLFCEAIDVEGVGGCL